MDIDFCLGYKFNKDTKKACDIKNSNELNGFYIYNFDKAYVNCGTKEFNKNTPESKIIRLVTETAIHETLHKVIYDITNEVANDTEENFITNMVKW